MGEDSAEELERTIRRLGAWQGPRRVVWHQFPLLYQAARAGYRRYESYSRCDFISHEVRGADWEKLGNVGWNWKRHQELLERTERYVIIQ